MNIALAQQNYHIGDFEGNTQKIIQAIERAKKEHADLIIFPELAVCGYPPLDFLEFDHFIEKCIESVHEIAKHCTSIAAIVGAPSINPQIEGKNLLNTAYFLHQGIVKQQIHKMLLPNYDVFDEYRYFESGNSTSCISFMGKKIAVTICEDLWDIEEDKMYVSQPMDALVNEKPDMIINIAASPFHYKHAANRKRVLHHAAQTYGLPVFYVNHVGAQTELIFDGGSQVLNASGNIVCELDYFKEDFRVFELQAVLSGRSVKYDAGFPFETSDVFIERMYNALILGIQDYFKKQGFTKAVLGLSGGIDSALVYALAIRALGNENVLGIMMPSPYSSDHSVSDSIQLAQNLHGQLEKIPINEAFNTINQSLSGIFKGKEQDVTEENIQARIRGVFLMAVSNKFGSILLNTSNKSEAAVGYGTLYGDMCGGLSVIGDVYKTQVYELARFINRNEEIIPLNIIDKAPSAELRPNQKDSDSLPDYATLDQILFGYIEMRKSPQTLINEGFNEELVRRVLHLVNRNEYKRFQTPPILRLSSKAFGMGRRMPIVANYSMK